LWWFSVEGWFKIFLLILIGCIVGFSGSWMGISVFNNYDCGIYMSFGGKLNFGVI